MLIFHKWLLLIILYYISKTLVASYDDTSIPKNLQSCVSQDNYHPGITKYRTPRDLEVESPESKAQRLRPFPDLLADPVLPAAPKKFLGQVGTATRNRNSLGEMEPGNLICIAEWLGLSWFYDGFMWIDVF